MFNASPEEVFAAEFFIITAINAWGAMSNGYAPWPPTIVMSALAMSILLLMSLVNPKIAEVLGIGFLLALLIGNLQSARSSGSGAVGIGGLFGAVPPDDMIARYDVLKMP